MLDRKQILKNIVDLKGMDSLGSLRAGILHIKRQVSSAPEAIDDGVVRVSRKYLIEELQQIAESQTLERARYYLDRIEKGVTQTRTGKINDINLNRWKEYEDIYTDSL